MPHNNQHSDKDKDATQKPIARQFRIIRKKEDDSSAEGTKDSKLSLTDQDIQNALAKALQEIVGANVEIPQEHVEDNSIEQSDQDKPAFKKITERQNGRSKMWSTEQDVTALKLNHKRRNRRRESVEDTWGNSGAQSEQMSEHKVIWSICIILGLILISGFWWLFSSFSGDDYNKAKNQNLLEHNVDAANQKRTEVALKIEEVSSTLNNYLFANSVDEKCKYIFKAEEYRSEIEEYYAKQDGVKHSGKIEIVGTYPVILDNKEYWQVVVEKDNSKHQTYYIRKNAQGLACVDWKSDIIYQENDIESFIASRSKEPTLFRVHLNLLKQGVVYNWGFTEDEYISLNVSFPNSDKFLWGYIKKDSETGLKFHAAMNKNLSYRFSSKTALREFVIKIKFPEDSPVENDQFVLIDEIVSDTWLNTEE